MVGRGEGGIFCAQGGSLDTKVSDKTQCKEKKGEERERGGGRHMAMTIKPSPHKNKTTQWTS